MASVQNRKSRAWMLLALLLGAVCGCWWVVHLNQRKDAQSLLRHKSEYRASLMVHFIEQRSEKDAADDRAATEAAIARSHVEMLHGVMLARPLGELLAEVPDGAGGLAVADAWGHVYFTKSFDDQQGVFRRNINGEDELLWKMEAGETHIEIAGREIDQLILVFISGPPLTSFADAWRHDGDFFRLGTTPSRVGIWPQTGHEELKQYFRDAQSSM